MRNVLTRGVVASDVDAAFTLPTGRGRIALSAALDVGHVSVSKAMDVFG